MASPHSQPPTTEQPPRYEREREDTRAAKKTRRERFAEAHAWVLEHHAETFRKLAK